MRPSRTVLMPLPESKEGLEWLARVREHYHELVMKKFEGFDVCGLPTPTRFGGLREHICNKYFPCPGLVLLYARLGFHRYNLLQGKNLQVSRVKKFNRSTHTLPGNYYITLEAKDPDFGSLQTFQVLVNERRYKSLVLCCSIARPLGETKKSHIAEIYRFRSVGDLITGLMPELPPGLNPFKQFYVLKKSEVQDNDWIRLYLELAVATTNRDSNDHHHDLSNLKILKVAIETTQDLKPHEGLRAYDATLYIRYKDSCEGKDVDRIDIVRRVLQERTYILGRIQSLETFIPTKTRKSKRAQLLFRRVLNVHKPWRLSSPRGRKAYRNRWRRLRLHKTRSI